MNNTKDLDSLLFGSQNEEIASLEVPAETTSDNVENAFRILRYNTEEVRLTEAQCKNADGTMKSISDLYREHALFLGMDYSSDQERIKYRMGSESVDSDFVPIPGAKIVAAIRHDRKGLLIFR